MTPETRAFAIGGYRAYPQREMVARVFREYEERLTKPSDAALAAGVQVLIDRGLDGPDGVGPDDIRAVLAAIGKLK